jgi:small subunit ribosomal protein S17e
MGGVSPTQMSEADVVLVSHAHADHCGGLFSHARSRFATSNTARYLIPKDSLEQMLIAKKAFEEMDGHELKMEFVQVAPGDTVNLVFHQYRSKMGRVRTRLVKRAARVIIEKYYARLTLDFDTNKKICEECAIIPSKRLRNKIAGFVTHLMKRIQRGPVRGISLKLQEEERERRMDFIPERSALDMDQIDIDADTKDLLRSLEFPEITGVVVTAQATGGYATRRDTGGGERRERRERKGGDRKGGDRERKAAAPSA